MSVESYNPSFFQPIDKLSEMVIGECDLPHRRGR